MIDKTTLAHHNHPKSLVYIIVHLGFLSSMFLLWEPGQGPLDKSLIFFLEEAATTEGCAP